MKKITKLALIFLVIVVVSFGVFLYKSNLNETGEVGGVSSEEDSVGVLVDVDGDGTKEEALLIYSGDQVSSMVVNDLEGNKVASTPEWLTFPNPIPEPFGVHSLQTLESKEFFSLEFTAGPHQTEVMFFEVYEDRIIPVCFKEELTGPKDCLFYSAKPDALFVVDLDNDGYVELVEYADEYPTDGELTEEEEIAIDEAFNEQEIPDLVEDAKRVARRESGGRGRNVVWAIFSYDGVYFEPQTEDNYEKFFSILKNDDPEVIKKSDLSNDSLEYNELTRTFWN